MTFTGIRNELARYIIDNTSISIPIVFEGIQENSEQYLHIAFEFGQLSQTSLNSFPKKGNGTIIFTIVVNFGKGDNLIFDIVSELNTKISQKTLSQNTLFTNELVNITRPFQVDGKLNLVCELPFIYCI